MWHWGSMTSLVLPAVPRSTSVARRAMVVCLGKSGVPADQIDDAAVVLSELVTNAVLHGGRKTTDDDLEVTWTVLRDRVRLSVRDSGRCGRLAAGRASSGATSGRGLRIVEHLSDRWCVQENGGTLVTAELGLVG